MARLVEAYKVYRALSDDEQEMFQELIQVAGKVSGKKGKKGKQKRKVSKAARLKMAKSQRARWAKNKKSKKGTNAEKPQS